MAVSPAIPAPASADVTVTAAKAKALVIGKDNTALSSEQSKRTTDSGLGNSAGHELAEQLNEEARQKYVKDKKLGEGTYAIVYLGHLRADAQSLVAIKKIKVIADYRDGLTMDAIREVKYLQELSHPNIIALHSVFSSKSQNLNLVLEFLPLGDLEQLIRDSDGVRYGAADVKAWMGMLGRAVWFCHENFVLHRDIKPNNLLIAADGEVKLADFGLARSFSDPYPNMTHQVITRWYRPPELLFGARHYSGAVDVWSMGIVFAELILRTPFLPGNTDVHQLELICQAIGTPTEENWPGVSKLPDYVSFGKDVIRPVQGRDYYTSLFGTAGPMGVDLLMSTLSLDPRKRPTARQFLQHKWWATEPRPTRKEDLPRKAGGADKVGEDLKRRAGEVDEGRGGKVSRKLDFGARK
ncbi:MAG: TFIIH complex serine/threonine-protein kinase subunit kin28 [Piccolia ochrophora]|nr:MAG: TFIIH complex serine/threonine-protein kinase subunit kin28 [Piccolia ochrophora]